MKEKKEKAPQAEVPKKKGKKKFIIIPLLVVILVVGAVVGGKIFLLQKKNADLAAAIEAADSAKIEKIVKDYSGSEKNLTEQLKKEADAIQQQFLDGNVDFTIAKNRLTAISSNNLIQSYIEEMLTSMEAMNKSMTAYANANNYITLGKYEAALDELANVIEEDPNYDAAQALMESAIVNYKEEAIANAKTYFAGNDYKNAFECLNKALTRFQADSDISSLINQYQTEYVESTLNQAKELGNANEYEEAVRLLEGASKIVESEKFTAAISQLWSYYVDYMIETAESKMADDPVEALEIVTQANTVHRDDRLAEAIKRLTAMQPKQITDCHLVDSDGLYTEEAFEDSYGNLRSWAVVLDDYGDSFGIYYLGEDSTYTKLKGTLCTTSEASSNVAISVEFSNNDTGKILKTYKDYKKTDAPLDINVDISGVKVLKIKATRVDSGKCCLAGLSVE